MLTCNFRARYVGLISFLGGLYLEKMLTARIMHACIKTLVKARHDLALESFCILISAVGTELENETIEKLSRSIIEVLGGSGLVQYSNHLNTRQVWYSNVRFVSGCQTVRYLNGGLKTGLKKACYGQKFGEFK